MFEGKLTIDISKNLEDAICKLCEAVKALSVENVHQHAPKPAAPATQQAAPDPETPEAAVPLAAAPTFTIEQVSKAGADLITAYPAKLPELQALLSKYDASYVGALKPEQLGTFATELRGLGARI